MNVDFDTVKRIGLAVVTFVMVCGLLKVAVPFVTKRLTRQDAAHQMMPAANLASAPAVVSPAHPQVATDKRMDKLERKVDRIETVITRVADDVQPPATVRHLAPIHHATRYKKVVVKKSKPVARPHRAVATRTVRKEAEPVIINTDGPQTEELF